MKRADAVQGLRTKHILRTLSLKSALGAPLETIRSLAADYPSFQGTADAMEVSLFNMDSLWFEVSFEYHDIFAFGFTVVRRPDLSGVASRGCYETLTFLLLRENPKKELQSLDRSEPIW